MEPTPHASRTADSRGPTAPGSAGQPSAAVDNELYGYSGVTGKAQPDEPGDATDRLARWDGSGTAYQLPRPPAPAQPAPVPEATAAPRRALIIDDLPEFEPDFPPPRRSAMPWALFGSALFIATALVLWQPWSADGKGDAPAQDHAAALPAPAQAPAPTVTETPAQAPRPIASEAPVSAAPEPLLATTEAPVQTPQPVAGEAAAATTLEESAEGDRSYIVRPAQTELPAEPPAVTVTVPPPPAEQPAQPAPTLAAEADAIVAVEKELSAAAPAPPAPREAASAARPVVAQAASKPASAGKAPAKAKPAAAQPGTLVVAIKPWGEVWVDGRRRGISPPLIKLQLPAGRHQVELRNPGLPSFEQTVEISAGQSLTLQHSFQ
jgi:hypothetical protein